MGVSKMTSHVHPKQVGGSNTKRSCLQPMHVLIHQKVPSTRRNVLLCAKMKLTTKLPSRVRRDALMHGHNAGAAQDPGVALHVVLQVAHASPTECTMTSANRPKE